MLNPKKWVHFLPILIIASAFLLLQTTQAAELSRPPIKAARLSEPLPTTCPAVAQSDLDAGCLFGYVYLNDVPVAGATVQIESSNGITNTVTAIDEDSSEPYYHLYLSDEPLLASSGTLITITVSYQDMVSRRTWSVQSGSQQVDLGLPSLSDQFASFGGHPKNGGFRISDFSTEAIRHPQSAIRHSSTALDQPAPNVQALPYSAVLAGASAEGDEGQVVTNLASLSYPDVPASSSGDLEQAAPTASVIYVKHDASGANNGTSWANAYTDLQHALAAAQEGDEIWVAAGTYKPTSGTDREATFQLVDGSAIYGGFTGSESSRDERDWEANVTILSGDLNGNDNDNVDPSEPTRADNSYHVVYANATDSTAVLSGFTITAGNGNANGTLDDSGGMRNQSSSATLTHLIFTNNSAVYGGGMSNLYNSTSTLTNVTFSNNFASGHGGAMDNAHNSTLTLINVTFSNNSASNYGGAMVNRDNSNPTVTNSIFWGNTGAQIYNDNSSPSVTYSLVQGGYSGNGNIDADPLFVDAANGDLRLQATSPAIDVGNNDALPQDTADCDGDSDTAEVLPCDLDGNPRVVNGTVDMGAYEYVSYALQFDGVDDYVDVGPVTSGTTLTYEGWIKPFSYPANSSRVRTILWDDNDAGGGDSWIHVDSEGKIGTRRSTDGFQVLDSENPINLNEWTHIAFVADSENNVRTLYINGVEEASGSGSIFTRTGRSSVRIGYARPNGNSVTLDPFHGLIDEIRIWNLARTQTDIQANMNRRLTGTEAGLIAYWQMNEGEGQAVIDYAGNNDGQLGSTDSEDDHDPTWFESNFPYDGLVAYWNFDNCDATDSSGNGYDGVINGTPECLDGKNGKAFNFLGAISENVEVDDFPDITDSLSIIAWIKPNNLLFSRTNPVVTKGFIGEPYTLWVDYNRITLLLNWNSPDRIDCSADATLDDSRFYHIGAVYDINKSKIALFVDGNKIGECDYDTSIYSNDDPLYISSSYPGGHDYFKGLIDEVRIYNRVLSEAEVEALFQQGTPQLSVSPPSFSLTLAEGESTTETLTISNTGTADLEWSINSNVTWLSTAPTSGTVALDSSASVSVGIDSTGLSAGTYTDTLIITSNAPDENQITIAVTLSVVQTTDVRVTNARDTTFTVSWLTNQSTTGSVSYGSDPNNLNQTANDIRGASTNDDTHVVMITGLETNSTIYFDVVSDGVTDDNDGAHYSVTTGSILAVPGSDTIYGQVRKSDGSTLAVGTIVYITLQDANGVGSSGEAAPLSALVDDTGYWFANLADARLADLSDYFTYSASADQIWLEAEGAADGHHCAITVDTADDSPATALVLSDDPCTWTIELELGWNNVALALEPSTPYSAESLCGEVTNQGGDIAEIDRWYTGGWDGHICGLSFNDFSVELANGYFIKGNRASSWTIEGSPVMAAVPLNLQVGWNSIAISHTDGYTAESLCDEIITQGVTALEIDRWFASGWSGHICGLPFNDFALERDQGYFVKSSSSGTVTPSLPASEGSVPASPPLQVAPTQPRSPDNMPVGQSMPVRDLRISNLTDSSVTFSWLTDEATTGYVLYGETADFGQVAVDVRRATVAGEAKDTLTSEGSAASETHVVTLTNLKPETSYYFKVVSGAEAGTRSKEDESAPDMLTTAPSLENIPESDTVYGQLFLADGETPATGTLVYLTLQERDGVGSTGEATLLSALVDSKGYWHANLGNARGGDLSDSFSYSASGDEVVIEAQGAGTASLTVDTANDARAPDMRLTTEPTSITVGAVKSMSSQASSLGMALALLALTLLAGVVITQRRL